MADVIMTAAAGQAAVGANGTAMLVLEYAKVFLSVQMVAGTAAVLFGAAFKDDIKSLIRRIASIKFPGGGELSTSQVEKSAEAAADERPEPQSVPEPNLPSNISLTPQEQDELRQIIHSERVNAFIWEYKYLNHYLAPSTQRVLDWFATLPDKISQRLFDNLWTPCIASAQERAAILLALQSHYLIDVSNDLIGITPKGKEYLQFRGPLPPA
jgi:hypothetical protein